MRPITLAALACALVGTACERTPRAVITTERDSAGVRVVEHGAHLPEAVLRLAPEPVVSIGRVDGAEAYQLHNVDHVARLSDGAIAVAHSGHEIRFYDAQGIYLRSAGRQGGGPGEFTRISFMRRIAGDSLLVYDMPARRVTILDPSGAYVRDYAPALAGPRLPAVAGALADGTLLVRRPLSGVPANSAVHRDTVQFSLLRGAQTVDLHTYLGAERTIDVTEAGGSIVSLSIMQLPFARDVHAAWGADRFITAAGDAWELRVWNAEGALDRIVRSAHATPREVTDELFAEYVEIALARRAEITTERNEQIDMAEERRQLEAMPRAAATPVLAGIVADQDGGFWVREWTMDGVDEGGRWLVFDGAGALRGVLDLPARFRPMHIENGIVLGVERDDLDVEYVRGYRIER